MFLPLFILLLLSLSAEGVTVVATVVAMVVIMEIVARHFQFAYNFPSKLLNKFDHKEGYKPEPQAAAAAAGAPPQLQ